VENTIWEFSQPTVTMIARPRTPWGRFPTCPAPRFFPTRRRRRRAIDTFPLRFKRPPRLFDNSFFPNSFQLRKTGKKQVNKCRNWVDELPRRTFTRPNWYSFVQRTFSVADDARMNQDKQRWLFPMHFLFLLFAGWINREQLQAID
jgi:hypothetical protein